MCQSYMNAGTACSNHRSRCCNSKIRNELKRNCHYWETVTVKHGIHHFPSRQFSGIKLHYSCTISIGV